MTKCEHHNTFSELDSLDTIALPMVLLEMIGAGLKLSSVTVYMYILGAADEYGGSVVRIHTSKILTATKLVRQTCALALIQLAEFNLVVSTQTDAKGIWKFELLNPETGAALPERSSVNFATLPDTVVKEFYRRELPDRWDERYSKFWCPFDIHSHPSFKVNLAIGTKKHGTWSCSQCGRDSGGKSHGDYGGLIKFYETMHNTEPQITVWRVKAILHDLISKEKHEYNREWEERAALKAFYTA